jgi:DNA damage-inducible protein 1
MERKFVLNKIRNSDPKAAEYLESNPKDLDRLMAQNSLERQILSNPNSLESQKAIEEAIRQQNILQNMDAAMESNPESYGYIDMLYLRFQVDGHAIDAFVDTGAQMTISKKRSMMSAFYNF